MPCVNDPEDVHRVSTVSGGSSRYLGNLPAFCSNLIISRCKQRQPSSGQSSFFLGDVWLPWPDGSHHVLALVKHGRGSTKAPGVVGLDPVHQSPGSLDLSFSTLSFNDTVDHGFESSQLI